MKDEAMEYPVIVQPLSEDDGGGYIAVFPDLPGCMSDGETPEEALENARDAFAEWMETAKAREGFTIPEPGARAVHMARERRAIKEALIALDQKATELDDELCELRSKIEVIEEHMEHNAEWERFEAIVGGSPPAVPGAHRKMLPRQ